MNANEYEFTEVTKEQFEAWLPTYPRPLERDYKLFVEPPPRVYHDFTLGHELGDIGSGPRYWASVIAIVDTDYESRHDVKWRIRSDVLGPEEGPQ